jgi:uncharacterized protein YndB with AHSA1/START domain
MPGTEIAHEVRIDAEPRTVFEFFTDPEKMVRWLGRSATLDPRPGGVYRVDFNGEDIARGEFVEVAPFERVIFTWGFEAEDNPARPGSSTVEVTLSPEADSTVVRLSHRDLPAEAVAPHDEGWANYVQRLATAATGGDPGPDPALERVEARS